MESFTKLFSSLLVFVYHCFDRIVINGYLSGLTRPENAENPGRESLAILLGWRRFAQAFVGVCQLGYQ